MDVQLSEGQRLLSETVKDWLRQRWSEEAAKHYFDDGILPSALWSEVAALGWLGVGTSEEGGGSGNSLADVVTLQEQMAAALFPTLVGSTIVVARMIDRAGDGPARNELLRSLISGEAAATIAVQGREGGFLSPPTARLTRVGSDWQLDGEKWFVRDAARAKFIAVRAAEAQAAEPCWALIEASEPGVRLLAQEGAAHDGQHRVTFEHVTVAAERVVTGQEQAVLIDAMVMEAARLAGIGVRAHSMAVEYAKTRVQFGRPIGSFQAIQHKVADMTTDVESASLATYYAAYCVDSGEEAFISAMAAKAWAGDAIQRVVREAHQIHGGVGYITEHPLHLYFRNALTGALLFGAPKELIPAVASLALTT